MPFVDDPSPPASTHPTYLVGTLRGLSFPAYLALGFVALSTICVFAYIAYSAYHTMSINKQNQLASVYKLPTASSGQWQVEPFPLAPSEKKDMDRLAVPSATLPRNHPRYDTHNIRFASPSINLAVFNNPKLVPVAGSAIPLSYDSRDNLFPNLFAPVSPPEKSTTKAAPLKRIGSVKAMFKNLRRPGKENVSFQMLSGNTVEDWR